MLTGRVKAIIASFIAVTLLAIVPVTGAQQGQTKRVRFPKGRTSVTLKGAAVRGTEDRYMLRAASGQTMTLHITSTEDNAVFNVIPPTSDRPLVTEQTDWTGRLPATGDYTIVVGPTRGNATYTLEVTVR